MSINRNRKGRRAYLNHRTSKFNSHPDPDGAAAAGWHKRHLGKTDLYPHLKRTQILYNPDTGDPYIDGKTGEAIFDRYTSTISEPRSKAVESWNKTIKVERSEYHVKLVDTPLQLVRMFFTTFNEYGCFWFKRLDRLVDVEVESFTYSSKANAMNAFKLNRILWKV